MKLFTTLRNHKRRIAALAMLSVLILGGWYGYGVFASVAKLTGDSNPLQLVSAFTSTTLATTNGRTNILVAGYSADDSGHQGAELTDSIMILSINQTTKAATVISIPRDLYVNIPGFGYSKINAAFEDGGMSLLEQVVETATGIHSNYQALINYTAFKDLVDAVGGVSVTINSSNSNGLYDPNTDLDLPNGTVTLNGQQALNLARARGEGYGSYGFENGDFDRSAHQQQILLAVAAKLRSGVSLTELSKISTALGDNVKTDMQIGELRTLLTDLKDIPASSITSVTLNSVNGHSLLTDYDTESGQSALIPNAGIDDYSAVQSALSQLLL